MYKVAIFGGGLGLSDNFFEYVGNEWYVKDTNPHLLMEVNHFSIDHPEFKFIKK
jgi:hypothetical protein